MSVSCAPVTVRYVEGRFDESMRVIIIGQKKAFAIVVKQKEGFKPWSTLKLRLAEYSAKAYNTHETQ